ncbi:Ribbon-helix-helix protein, copG family [compost metagenome]
MSDMVMRSIYLRPEEDGRLRQLAHELRVSKADLIRSAVASKLQEWTSQGGDAILELDLKTGKRETLPISVID